MICDYKIVVISRVYSLVLKHPPVAGVVAGELYSLGHCLVGITISHLDQEESYIETFH